MRILDVIKVPAKLEYLHQCVSLVSACARQQGFDDGEIRKIELSTEEALVNIFKYAYRDQCGDVKISCTLDPETTFVVEIEDSGVPFDVLNVPSRPVCSNDESSRSGGLGIFMIKTFTDKVRYRREEGKNILTLVVSSKDDQHTR